MQNFNKFNDSDYISDAPDKLNDNFQTIASDYAGTSFPTTNLVEGMACYRTDEGIEYRYIGGKWVSPFATQAQAAEGVDNTKAMTPLRTKNAIDKQRPLKTYTTFEQLGYSTIPTLETLVSNLPSFTKFVRYINQSDAETLGLPDYGILEITKAQFIDYASLYLQRRGGKDFIRKAFFENWGKGQNAFQWKQLLASNNIATQTQAEEGTDNTTVMTPLRTAQEIDSKRPIKTYTSLAQLGLDDSASENDIILKMAVGATFVFPFYHNTHTNFELAKVVKEDGCLIITRTSQEAYRNQIIFKASNTRTTLVGECRTGTTKYYKVATKGALSMPSGNPISVSLSYGSIYQAPTDGWLLISSPSGSGFYGLNVSTSNGVGEYRYGQYKVSVFLPLAKGDTAWLNENMSVGYCNFICAQSEV